METNTGSVDPQPEFTSDDEYKPYLEEVHQFAGEEGDTREETFRLALESIVRWTDRSFDTDFRDALIVRAIAQVAEVALGIK